MAVVDLVGPKGFEHGWKFVGVPGVTSHSDLLRMRSEARKHHPQGHPERLKAERAVRHSRKLKEGTAKATGKRPEPGSAPVTPGESPSGLGPPPDVGIQRSYRAVTEKPAVAPGVRAAVGRRQSELALKPAKRGKGGLHPSELTVSEPHAMTGYHYPNARARSHGARPIPFPELRSSVSDSKGKVIAGFGTRQHTPYGNEPASHTAELSSGSKSTYLGSAPRGMSHEEAHAHFGEIARQSATAEVNARRARAALSARGHSAVKSHSTSVRGWHNIDPGHEVKAGDKGVGITYYGGSSLVGRSKDPSYQADRLREYERILQQQGFHVERNYDKDSGTLRGLYLRNDKQGNVTSVGGSQATGTTTTSASAARVRQQAFGRSLGSKSRPVGTQPATTREEAAQITADRLLKVQKEQGTAAAQQAFLDELQGMLGGRRRGGRRRRYANDRPGLELSVDTPRLVATPAPLGKPGGPGLYGLKGAKLPNYIENMRNALIRGGMSEGRATATAINRCKKLALTSKHPEVKAAAAAAIAELKVTAARAHAAHHTAPGPGAFSNAGAGSVIELFNPYHAPPGTGGGRFTTASGAGSGAKQSGLPSGGRDPRKAKAEIMRQVSGLRKRISSQTVQLRGLQAQRKSLITSVSGGSKATGTTVARKAKKSTVAKSKTTVKQKAGAKRKATVKHTGAAKASARAATAGQIARLGMRISSLRQTIATERGQVSSLLAKARKM